MSLKESVDESVSWARQRLEKLRLRYMDAIQEAERQGEGRLNEIKRQVEQLGPSLRHLVDEQVESLQSKLDEVNQRLADEAVPEERKSRVGRLALERKAASAAQMATSVVRSRTQSKASQSSTTNTSKKSASAKAASGARGKKGENSSKASASTKPKRPAKSSRQGARKSGRSTGKDA